LQASSEMYLDVLHLCNDFALTFLASEGNHFQCMHIDDVNLRACSLMGR
jgi:hypothetical protein